MKYMKKILFSTLLLATCLVACKRVDVDIVESEMGSLSFVVEDLTDYVTVETKSGVDYSDYSNYDVVVEGPTKLSGKYGDLFEGEVVELSSGRYSITVTSPATLPAAFDQPIYQAYEEFEIRAGEVTDLKLTCTPANCKVTFELSDNFKKELAAYEVVVKNGLGELVWIKNATQDDFASNKAGYFLPRGLQVDVKGYRSIDNTVATATYFVKNPQPAEHHIVKLDAKVTGAVGGITISVVTTFNEVENDIHVDGMDEEYVDRPDFGDGDDEGEDVSSAPSIVWEANPYFDPISIAPGDQISMTIKAPRGISTFRVDVSDNFKAAVSMITNITYVGVIDEETGELQLTEKRDTEGNIVYMKDADGEDITDAEGNRIPVMEPLKKNFAEEGAETPVYKTVMDVYGKDAVDYIDLINHAYIWYSFGLPVGADVKGETNVVFELTPFIDTLCGAAGGLTVEFILMASDTEGEEILVEGEYPTVTINVPVAPES